MVLLLTKIVLYKHAVFFPQRFRKWRRTSYYTTIFLYFLLFVLLLLLLRLCCLKMTSYRVVIISGVIWLAKEKVSYLLVNPNYVVNYSGYELTHSTFVNIYVWWSGESLCVWCYVLGIILFSFFPKKWFLIDVI